MTIHTVDDSQINIKPIYNIQNKQQSFKILLCHANFAFDSLHTNQIPVQFLLTNM